jgi:ribosome maturation factor RimP
MGFEIDQVREIVERVATGSGLEVVEVELRGSGKARMLRIVIDKVPEPDASGADKLVGVTHQDCANLSREVGTLLDVEDVIPGNSYLLEVSSPGLDRKLVRAADYARFTGSQVKLKTRTPVNGNQHFEGRLQSFHDGRLTLEVGATRKKARPHEAAKHASPQTLEIELANVEKANLVPEI